MSSFRERRILSRTLVGCQRSNRRREGRAVPLAVRGQKAYHIACCRMRSLSLITLILACAFGQTSRVPYASDSDGPGPTFTSKIAESYLPGRYSAIQKVDFRNLKPMKNGRYRKSGDGVHYSEEVDSIHYLGPPSGGQAALVLYSWLSAGGSSSQGGVAEVFRTFNGALRSTQKITWDTHFQAGQPTVAFDTTTNTLMIRSAHYIPGDAHCCVSAMDVVTFRWDGTAFVQADLQTELSEYGKKEGKTLPH